ncbi:hypothetical protein RclHR1_00500009 [Rhizophagus clarus]|uniref:Kinase-like domain-containing protein n=1 Tax=Rhizophagus clarus TaxID=94130 RepID=A0A2Z6RLW3_9GLOM|nr:hypothetical protein RclHR1_00500009 [Rhizophagus clarus]GES97473.1 kinase-like domain-containing protein [Rhizophagus clarus]
MAKATDLSIETTTAVINHIELETSVAIPFSQFIPLIKDVNDIISEVTDLCKSAQHCKNIVKILLERISTVNVSINILQARGDLTSTYYKSLQRLLQILQGIKIYSKEITQYNTVQKFLGTNTVEKKFKELCEEYDSSIISLNSSLSVNFFFNTKQDDEIVKEDVEQLLKFQEALAESMKDVQQKVNVLIERVSEMSITMQTMQNLMDIKKKKDDVSKIQTKIDNIFSTSLLPFDDYKEADEKERSNKLRKYVHIKIQEEYAFKVMEQEHFYDVKNQVTILMKLKDCQNIINFYGLTSNDSKTYLITEWAEKGNLREYILTHGQNIDLKFKIRISYDIAKGLNFLNAVKIFHRDVRAENIVITDHDIAKITNIKYRRRVEEVTDNIAINKESVRYCPPERLRRGITGEKNDKYLYDAKCEVYSFGILLWEIAECKIPYDKFEDFMEITKKVVGGYREKFTPGTDIPMKYQDLVNKSVDQNPGSRPILSRLLTDLMDIFRSLETPNRPNSLSNSPKIPPVRKMTQIEEAEDCTITNWNSFNTDWDSFDYMTLDKAIERHKNESKDKEILYKCFDTYANMDSPRAKYWKAYYISKDWSNLDCSNDEKHKLSAQLLKAAADYGDEIPDAQLRYATMIMQGKGVKPDKEEAVKYFLKAAKNGHVVAMFNIATYYYSLKENELGNYYMISAANKGYEKAIDYCKKKNVPY